MSYVCHHAIIVSSSGHVGAAMMMEAHDKAIEIFDIVSNILLHKYNGGQSFFIGPDGSKEGWEESNSGDIRRTEFMEWLLTKRFSDGSGFLSWIEVSYCNDGVWPPAVQRSSYNPDRNITLGT